MKKFYFALGFVLFLQTKDVLGSEAGMPQLNPEFWVSQIFWLVVIFSVLYSIISKIFLPKITYSIESRKSKIVNDLNEAQKFKEKAGKKLNEYNQIIEKSKTEAKKIFDDNRRELDKNIESKKQKLVEEIEKEFLAAEKEIKELKKTSIQSVCNVASETSAEIIKKVVNAEVNNSNVSAIVSDIAKKKMEQSI